MPSHVGPSILLAAAILVGLAAVLQAVVRRRQLSSGREVSRVPAERTATTFRFDHTIESMVPDQWWRLLLDVRLATSDEARGLRWQQVAKPPEFTLTLSDDRGRAVYTRKGSLAPFLSWWLASRRSETETLLSSKSHARFWGTVTLLELLPAAPCRCRLLLEIMAVSEASSDGSRSRWEVEDAVLVVREGVTPFTRTVSYPHERVRV